MNAQAKTAKEPPKAGSSSRRPANEVESTPAKPARRTIARTGSCRASAASGGVVAKGRERRARALEDRKHTQPRFALDATDAFRLPRSRRERSLRAVPRTALIVAVPEAEPLVGEWRAKHDWSAQHGVPAHITLLFPFVPADEVDEQLLGELRDLFASQPAFDVPAPAGCPLPRGRLACARASRAVQRADRADRLSLPGVPALRGNPRRGHRAPDSRRGRAGATGRGRRRADANLPIEAEAREVTLIVEDASGHWHAARGVPARGLGRGLRALRRVSAARLLRQHLAKIPARRGLLHLRHLLRRSRSPAPRPRPRRPPGRGR